jgi:tetratricopeptide (TPR) repeat protein
MSCASTGPLLRQAWRALSDAMQTPDGCQAENGQRCDVLRRQIERFSIDCPNNPDVLMANALLTFDSHNLARTQQLLDELLNLPVTYPEAAVLRARIALEQGNMQFALRFLREQINQSGDHAGLRETYASTLYLTGRFEEAMTQIGIAQRLGAPVWRVAFCQGLIEEATGKFDAAKLRYQEALQARPGWHPAESRLRALIATGKVSG